MYFHHRIQRDPHTREEYIEVPFQGKALLEHSLFNKSSAFSEEEREAFKLHGLLPPHVSTLEQQLQRVYENYKRHATNLDKYVYLSALQDRNTTLFYRLLLEHIEEMMPIVYTPVVGEACQHYSHIYRRSRGLYLSYPLQDQLERMLDNVPQELVEVVVVSDGERILGLGDLGIGGMGIPQGKLTLYTLCAGIHPATTLPVLLDTGTDNPVLLNDPLYLGWKHPRVRGEEYDGFVDRFVQALKKKFPHVLLQWEDFARENASRLLEKYRGELCSFNDDIQGTGAVSLAALLAAAKATGTRLSEHRFVFYGAGSSAWGITRQIQAKLLQEGLALEEIKKRIFWLDRRGLIYEGREGVHGYKAEYAQSKEVWRDWRVSNPGYISLEEVVENAQPTVLIGTSTVPSVFSQRVVETMARYAERPIIFPLSNPTSKAEAHPRDLLRWSGGRAIVAAGSPFGEVEYDGRIYRIAQCNNAYIFPGVGLGVVVAKAREVSDSMFLAAAEALSALSPMLENPTGPLLPPLTQIREVSRKVAMAVAQEAMRLGLHREDLGDLEEKLRAKMWYPRYYPYRLPKGL
ncbi:MAG: NAD-dependent malic enzyme [Planctomycetota bacterium]|nr:MAG: NAD-dependent malic enzyme [Planctomycetota bacterium]